MPITKKRFGFCFFQVAEPQYFFTLGLEVRSGTSWTAPAESAVWTAVGAVVAVAAVVAVEGACEEAAAAAVPPRPRPRRSRRRTRRRRS